jgi:hypothetical protein
VLRKRANGALLLAAGSRAMSWMAESSSDDEEGDRCTLLSAGGRGDRTTSAGRNRDSPRPSTNGGGGADCKVGEWRRDQGEETEEEEVGEKKVEQFWTRDFGSDRGVRCRRLLVRSGWRGAPVTRSGSRVGLVGWASRVVVHRLVGCISYRRCTHVWYISLVYIYIYIYIYIYLCVCARALPPPPFFANTEKSSACQILKEEAASGPKFIAIYLKQNN